MRHIFLKPAQFFLIITIVMVILYGIMSLMPGDPKALLSPNFTGETLTLFSSLTLWLEELLQGNLGWSILFDQAVSTLLFPAMMKSILLTISGITLTLIMTYYLCLFSCLNPCAFLTKVIDFVGTLSLSTPAFWVCLLLLYIALQTTLPVDHFILKFTLSVFAFMLIHIGLYYQHFKAQLTKVFTEDYIRTALSKGASRRQAFKSHAIPNALLPLLGIVSITFGQAFNGQLIIEIIFNYPGMGRLILDGLMSSDIALAFPSVFFAIIITLCATLILQITEHFLTPKKRIKK